MDGRQTGPCEVLARDHAVDLVPAGLGAQIKVEAGVCVLRRAVHQ